MRTATVVLVALLVGCCQVAPRASSEERSYPCYRSAASPKLDGIVISDPCWQALPGATGFYKLGGGHAEAKQTTAFAMWDDDAVYVAMVCEEQDVEQVKTDRRDGDDLWLDDSVEIFVRPAQSLNVFQFIINTTGARRGGEGNPGNTTWEAAAQKGKADWTVEVKLPFKVLGRKPQPGEVWTATFCRNIFIYASGGDKFTCWAPLQSRFLEPENYARLTFEAKTLTVGQAQAIEAGLNRPYRVHLTRQLTDAAKDVREYAEVVGRAAKDKSLEEEAASLQREWQTVQQVLRQVGTAPLADLRAVVRSLESLKQRSYEMKYRVLFKELLEEG